MRIEDIEKLLKLFDASTAVEMEIKEMFGHSVRLSKVSTAAAPIQPAVPVNVAAALPNTPPVKPAVNPETTPVEPPPKTENKNTAAIRSPIVGTFYRAPAPDAPPYVDVGDIVKPGQVVCIVEAMKLMNEIESDIPGRIVKILVKNEEPVQYNQELFLIEPL